MPGVDGGRLLACRGRGQLGVEQAAVAGERAALPLVGNDDLVGHGVVSHRVAGLWAGIDIDPAIGTGKEIAKAMAARGVLVKDTHGSTIRFAPPLVVTDDEVATAIGALAAVLRDRS